MRTSLKTIIPSLFVAFTGAVAATPAVNDQNLTSLDKLRNDIPLISRETPGSEIVTLSVSFLTGSADESFNRRAITSLALDAMSYATKRFPKSKIFALTEKNSIGLGCSGGIEVSRCSVETIQENLPQAIDLLAAVVLEPSFNDEDVNLAKQQRIADYRQESQNPESQVNAVVNSIFYDKYHPYRLLPQDGVKQTEGLNSKDLKAYHQGLLDASNMFITYAGPKMSPKVKNSINSKFGKIAKKSRPKKIVAAPQFDPKNTFAFEHRQIPTAYIKLKFNAPSVLAKDATAADIMFEILSDKLQEEVRTKRSLSYAIYAETIQHTQGIGMISASTSKPEETLDAIAQVIKAMKEKGVSQEELDEYRNGFTTSYFLTLESQDSLAGALASFQAYFGDARRLYDVPNRLANVTPADVQRLAKDLLKDFRVGVVYDKDKFNPKWIEPLRKI